MEKFILRDGEIAFIENGETRMIMNVNTAFDVLNKLEERERQKKIEEAKREQARRASIIAAQKREEQRILAERKAEALRMAKQMVANLEKDLMN